MTRNSSYYKKRSRSRSNSRDRDRRREKRRRSRSRERSKSKDRSRSPERSYSRRSRSRDKERDRDRSRKDRKYESSRSKRRTRSRSKDRSSRNSKPHTKDIPKEKVVPVKEEEKKEVKNDDDLFDPSNRDKEVEAKKLEEEMKKRRERIERWRAERKKKELEAVRKDIKSSISNIQIPSKKWNLEDDSDEEEENKDKEKETPAAPVVVEEEAEEEIDPLDAFMMGVNEEVKKVNKLDEGKAVNPTPTSGVVIMTGVAKKTSEQKRKGELIEQNQDGLEYSSEEEEEDLNSAAANLANKQKKDLAKIDHSGVEYIPFRKTFYVEVPEIAKMTNEEVAKYREDLEGIRVRGKNCPKPIKTWAHCGVSKKVFEALKKHGFEKPTPIQVQAVPAIMSGRDTIGIAKTGSGKTLAFVLPMLRHILDQPELSDTDGPIAMIMGPTRELVMQIGKETRKFTKSLGLRVVCVYGGTGISEQIAELKRGAEIIVCTPGRMIDMLTANNGRVTNLRRVTYVVLDEADRMFDMGFEPQVMKIIDNIRPDRQVVMFSATFPRQMEALARRILNKPIEIQVGGRSIVCKDVEQHVIVLEEDAKFLKLLEILGHYYDQGSTIIFVDKQENADTLLKDLMKASYSCMALHGGIDQYDRDSNIVDFKNGKIKILIATSVAARGLDVKHMILVVNYDCPNHYEDYVHRCGRTGRAGNKGFAYTFITKEQERFSGDVVRALELSNVPVPPELDTMWVRYRAKQAAEGKKVHTGGGFSGKGFKFDETEAALANEKKKVQKVALGLQDSDDEDIEGDIDQQIESMLAPKRIVKEIKAPVDGNAATTAAVTGVTATTQPTNGATSMNTEKLDLAKRLASKINIQKNLGPDAKAATQQTAEAIMKGGASQPLITAKTVAEQLAAKLNNRLNYQPKEEEDKEEEEEVETFHKYEEELEINDFPQQARWRVTSKEALAQIAEYSEAGITVRGTYYPPGKNPPEGDRKLYLAIESVNELSVSKAKVEITRLIKEELLKLTTAAHHVGNKARYKVL
ncbi:probable ATP-dependent RNA helicase DDX46 [Planococcus citri]|uniref:probable ATP-dependent RNA helicase DDX46 n=1 Tax=Planococcus citri TaxID=170843 RepID=UPI0031F75768